MRLFTSKSLTSRLACMFFMGCMAQTVAAQGTIIDLLPDGVTVNVNPERKKDKAKNIVIAGSPEKGYKAFFAATDAEHGEELWVTDGTKEGTHMVKDIVPGEGTSNPSYLGRLNDKVLFSAYTDESGAEAWVSDGTEEGTFQLVDAYAYGDGDPKAFTQMNETKAIFVCIDDESAEWDTEAPQHWLWVTDGTKEGTHRVVSGDGDDEHQANCIFPGKDNTTLHTAYCRVGRRVFFKADTTDGMIGEEVWVTDGTAEGTYLVMDINWEKGTREGQTCSAGIDNFANYKNERLFFQAWTPNYGGEPWTTDGVKGEPNTQEREVSSGLTEAGDDHTYMIKDTRPGQNPNNGIGYHAGTFGVGFEVYKDRMWYRGFDPSGGFEFSGTNMQKGDYKFYDIFKEEPSVDHNSFSDPGCVFDGVYIFCAATGFDGAKEDNYGGELHYFDGESVRLQSNFVPGTNSNWAKEQTVAGGSMYWMNETNGEWNQGFGTGLYRLDSKDASPVVCERIDPSASSTGDMVHTLRNLGGTIIYAAGVTNRIYCYKYTKDGWDGKSDMGYLEPDFMTEAEKTAIKNINIADKTDDNNIYNLSGQRMQNLQKGVNIVNGRKIVIR